MNNALIWALIGRRFDQPIMIGLCKLIKNKVGIWVKGKPLLVEGSTTLQWLVNINELRIGYVDIWVKGKEQCPLYMSPYWSKVRPTYYDWLL